MSQQLQVTLICDMSPHETATPADRTVTLGIDGGRYELEVCAKHELQLLQTLGRYTMAARKVPRPGMRPNSLRTTQDRHDSRGARAGAVARGHEPPERGRLPPAVLRASAAAHALGTPAASP